MTHSDIQDLITSLNRVLEFPQDQLRTMTDHERITLNPQRFDLVAGGYGITKLENLIFTTEHPFS